MTAQVEREHVKLAREDRQVQIEVPMRRGEPMEQDIGAPCRAPCSRYDNVTPVRSGIRFTSGFASSALATSPTSIPSRSEGFAAEPQPARQRTVDNSNA